MPILKVLVLDPAWEQTAYLVSCLASAGLDVVLASSLIADPMGIGWYCRQVIVNGSLASPERLSCLLAQEPADVVLPLCEDILAGLWTLPAGQISRVFPYTSQRQRDLLTDRRQMYRFASDVGVPVPESVTISDMAALGEVLEHLGYPCVLRGTQGLAGQQVRVVGDLEQAVSAYCYLQEHSPGPPFAQRFVSGQRCLIGGLFDDGQMLQWFSQATVEASSPTGPSIRVRSVRDNRLTDYARRLFGELRWSGLACAEFIRDDQGNYHFLEINPRPWAAIRAADRCGVPLLEMFARYLKGEKPDRQVDFPAGREVALFPQFVAARLRAGRLLRWSDRRAYLEILAGIPWTRPALVLHLLRRVWWARGG